MNIKSIPLNGECEKLKWHLKLLHSLSFLFSTLLPAPVISWLSNVQHTKNGSNEIQEPMTRDATNSNGSSFQIHNKHSNDTLALFMSLNRARCVWFSQLWFGLVGKQIQLSSYLKFSAARRAGTMHVISAQTRGGGGGSIRINLNCSSCTIYIKYCCK